MSLFVKGRKLSKPAWLHFSQPCTNIRTVNNYTYQDSQSTVSSLHPMLQMTAKTNSFHTSDFLFCHIKHIITNNKAEL